MSRTRGGAPPRTIELELNGEPRQLPVGENSPYDGRTLGETRMRTRTMGRTRGSRSRFARTDRWRSGGTSGASWGRSWAPCWSARSRATERPPTVVMPAIDVGSTTFTIVSHFGTPRASVSVGIVRSRSTVGRASLPDVDCVSCAGLGRGTKALTV